MLILERMARKERSGPGARAEREFILHGRRTPGYRVSLKRPLHSTANLLDHCEPCPLLRACRLVVEFREVDRKGFSVMCISGGYHLANHGETSPRRDALISRGTTTRKLVPRASRFRGEGSKQSLFILAGVYK
jgi:hypothetical protein